MKVLSDDHVRKIRKMMMLLVGLEKTMAEYQAGEEKVPEFPRVRGFLNGAVRAQRAGDAVAALDLGFDEYDDFMERKFDGRIIQDPDDTREAWQIHRDWRELKAEARGRMEAMEES